MQLPQSHKKGVTCITGVIISPTDGLVASTSSDGTVNIWEVAFPSTSGGEQLLLTTVFFPSTYFTLFIRHLLLFAFQW